MNSQIQPIKFQTSLLGSLPRPKEILQAQRKLQKGEIFEEDFTQLVIEYTEQAIKFQENLGLDIITSGELGRDNYVSFIARKLHGIRMMSMIEILDYIEDKEAFHEILNILDVPAMRIKNAICTGKLGFRNGIVVDELLWMKKFTPKPIKITLPGPYLMTRSMWLPELSKKAYPDKEALGEAVIQMLTKEIALLQQHGADIIQLDEPVLTEVVFSEGKTRSFMCAALSEKKDPTDELAFATHLLQSVVQKVDRNISKIGLHICRGNWSKDESILLKGPYTPLIPLMEQVCPDILFLEFSTPRAGELSSLLENDTIRKKCILGLGVMNPRTDTVETKESMIQSAKKALQYVSTEQLWLNPDCGFATFSNRPVNEMDTIIQKVSNMVQAAKELRRKYV
ncbi:MAG TPA: cobalamin-independent methionine synthase II family protein [Firmicutes bacterium]|nr:cobalamin-independent methionine synthase II family protein [Bacillota bacterium]